MGIGLAARDARKEVRVYWEFNLPSVQEKSVKKRGMLQWE